MPDSYLSPATQSALMYQVQVARCRLHMLQDNLGRSFAQRTRLSLHTCCVSGPCRYMLSSIMKMIIDLWRALMPVGPRSPSGKHNNIPCVGDVLHEDLDRPGFTKCSESLNSHRSVLLADLEQIDARGHMGNGEPSHYIALLTLPHPESTTPDPLLEKASSHDGICPKSSTDLANMCICTRIHCSSSSFRLKTLLTPSASPQRHTQSAQPLGEDDAVRCHERLSPCTLLEGRQSSSGLFRPFTKYMASRCHGSGF